VVYLPDTQDYYTSEADTRFADQCTWVVNNQATYNIEMVLHEGDVISDGTLADPSAQWTKAQNAMNILQTADIPNLLCPGNHDTETGGGLVNWNTYFPTTRYTGKAWFSGGFSAGGQSQNVYTTMTIGTRSYVFMCIEYNPSSATMEWAKGIWDAHQDKTILLCTHAYLDNNNARIAPESVYVWAAAKRYSNIILIGCGHDVGDGLGYLASGSDWDTTIHQCLANWQFGGGNGYLRLVTVKPNRKEMLARSYSPTLNNWLTDSQAQFVMKWE
jgi:hypothetical protein